MPTVARHRPGWKCPPQRLSMTSRWYSNSRLLKAAISAKAMSATASWLVPKPIATATPWRVAAATSTAS